MGWEDDCNNRLTILVMIGIRSGRHDLKRFAAMWSKEQDLMGESDIKFLTSSIVSRVKVASLA